MVLGLCSSAKKKHARKAPHRFLKTTNVTSALQQLETEEKVLHQVLFIEDALTESGLTDRLAKSEQAKANRVGTRGNTVSQQQDQNLQNQVSKAIDDGGSWKQVVRLEYCVA